MKSLFKLTMLTVLVACSVSTILIVQPQNSGFDDNKVPYGFANFGNVAFGKTNSYQLTPMDSQLCNTGGLKHLDPTENNTYFLVQSSGTCSYTQQARTAQALGASGIIIGTDQFARDQ